MVTGYTQYWPQPAPPSDQYHPDQKSGTTATFGSLVVCIGVKWIELTESEAVVLVVVVEVVGFAACSAIFEPVLRELPALDCEARAVVPPHVAKSASPGWQTCTWKSLNQTSCEEPPTPP